MKYQIFFGALVLAIGIAGGFYIAGKSIKSGSELIEVKGLSEKIVKSDIGEFSVRISNKNEDIEELYKKIISDKNTIVKFLRENGVLDSEISIGSLSVWETENYNAPSQDRKKYFEASDSIQVCSKDIEKILKIKSKVIELTKQKVFASYSYSFKLIDFSTIKMEMMKDASEAAKKSAEAFIAPHGKQVGDVAYLKQGEISIRAANEEDGGYSNSEVVNKKLRLVVRAGFHKKD